MTDLVDGIRRGSVGKAVALRTLLAEEPYFLAAVTPEYAGAAWRRMAALHGTPNVPDAERAFVIRTFVEDAVRAGYSAAELDAAAVAWRDAGETFVPTFGALHKAAREAKVAPGRSQLSELRDRANGTYRDSSAYDPDMARLEAQRRRKPDPDEREELPKLRTLLAQWEAEKACGERITEHGEIMPWCTLSETMLNGLRLKVERLERAA